MLKNDKVLERLNKTLEKIKSNEDINNMLKIAKLEKVDENTSQFMVWFLDFISFLESIKEEVEKLEIEDEDKTHLTKMLLYKYFGEKN